ncbi:MAG: ABC transporter ATP-binding protein [Acidobacteriota bacterium]
MAVIECIDVKKTYRSGQVDVNALRGVSLAIEQGEFVALTGPSGCGKTTLLNIIGGLDRPKSGDVCVEGQSLNDLGNSDLADLRLRRIGFIFQAYNLVPVLSGLENVEFIMQLQGVGRADRRRRASEVLASVGLAEVQARRPAELSGGQQQRVAVARALASNPAIILADEPTANLDSRTSQALLELMRELNEKENLTLVVASHDPKVLEFVRRHVTVVDGRIHSDT